MGGKRIYTVKKGDKFNRLTVIREVESKRQPNGALIRFVECQCDCGNIITLKLSSLKTTKSCGCLTKETAHKFHKKLIFVFGVNDLDGYVQSGKETEPVYDFWYNVICRCYNEKHLSKRPYYRNCSISSEWRHLSNFKKWFDENYNPITMIKWQLDKDILIKGNKVYSPNTCCFVPQEINTLFTKCNKNRGKYPIGVSFKDGKYVAQVNRGKGSEHLGRYNTQEEAFNAYKEAKEAYIKDVADEYKGAISVAVYQAMYNYKVEITD